MTGFKLESTTAPATGEPKEPFVRPTASDTANSDRLDSPQLRAAGTAKLQATFAQNPRCE